MVDSVIRLFEQNTEPTYNSSTTRWDWVGLGIGTISDAISCVVEEERNGKFELTMEYPTTGMRYNEFQINRIIVAKPNPDADPQGFRIYQISKSFERVITINAEHISYQLSHVPVLPLTAQNCKQAMDALFNSNNQAESCNFQYWSDKTSTYFPSTSGKVRTGDYDGRALEFEWTLVSQTSSSSTISWTLKGVGKLAGYTNGWVMCGPVNLSIGSIKLLENAHDHPNRVQVRENQVIDAGTKVIAHTSGKFSGTINLDTILYYDNNGSGLGKYAGTGTMTLPDTNGGDSGDATQFGEFKIDEPISLRAALGGDRVSILNTYGGEFEWDNLTVKLHSARGTDKGVTIRYGKNLTSLEQEETIANTFTGIVPYWKGQEPDDQETGAKGAVVIVTPTHILRDGVPLSDVPAAQDGGVTVTSDALYSDNADQYPYKRTQVKNLTDYFNDWSTSEEITSQTTQLESFWYKVPMPQDVYDVAKEWVAANELGIPEVNLNVEFVPLWQTEEYKTLALQESVSLCDMVHVFFEELGVTTSAKVVKTKYDVLLNRYNSIDLSSLGKLQATLATTIASTPAIVDAAVQETQHFVTAALSDATNRIAGVYGGSMITNKDENGHPYELVFAGDPDIDEITGEETYGNFMRINKEGIGFSTQGYNGPFNSAWTIDGTFDAQQINVINLNADSMTAGTLKSANWESSGGAAGFSLNLQDGTIQAPSLKIEARNVNNLSVGGRNVLKHSKTLNLSAYSGASLTITDNITVSEWGAADAKRVTGTGGSNIIFGSMAGVWLPSGTSVADQPYVFSVYLKNVGTNTITIGANGMGSGVAVRANEAKRVVIYATGNGSRYIQFTFVTAQAGYAVDFVYWHPQIELGTIETDWAPAPEDYEEFVSQNYSTLNITDDKIETAVRGVETHFYSVGAPNLMRETRYMPTSAPGNDYTRRFYFPTVSEKQFSLSRSTDGDFMQANLSLSGLSEQIWPYFSSAFVPRSKFADATKLVLSFEIKVDSLTSWQLIPNSTTSSGILMRIIVKTPDLFTMGAGGFRTYSVYLRKSMVPTAGKWTRVFLVSPELWQDQGWQNTSTAGSWDDVTHASAVIYHSYNGSVHIRKLKLEKGSLNTDWTEAKEDGIPGGTNLLADTLKDAGESHDTYVLANFNFTDPLIVGRTYTLSAKVRTTSDKKSVIFCYSGGTIWISPALPRTTDGIYSYTFVATPDMTSSSAGDGYGYCRVYASNNEGVQGGDPIIGTGNVEWIKIEFGNAATDWSPAPSDASGQLNDYGDQIKQIKETIYSDAGILERMTGVEIYANKEKIDELIGDTLEEENGVLDRLDTIDEALLKVTPDEIKGIVSNETKNQRETLEKYSSWFTFTARNGLQIGAEGSQYKTQIDSDSFDILSGNTAIASFAATGLTTTSITLSSTFSLPPFTLESINNSSEWLLTK